MKELKLISQPECNWRLTGADTMAGRYLLQRLQTGIEFSQPVAFLCHTSEEEENARELNLQATEDIVKELETDLPAAIIYLSSRLVYSPEAGEGVDETRPTFARGEAGKWIASTELMLEKWCAAHGVTLTIVRPALMFGTGVDGWLLRLFNRVVRGHYVHIRDNDAKTSLVTALDVAEAMTKLAGKPGIFNLSDGRSVTWLSLMEAMSANAGAMKRMTHLPAKWADFIYRWFRWVPIVEETISPKALEPFSQTLVLDNSRCVRETGMQFHDTLAVIARQDKTYPYENP